MRLMTKHVMYEPKSIKLAIMILDTITCRLLVTFGATELEMDTLRENQ